MDCDNLSFWVGLPRNIRHFLRYMGLRDIMEWTQDTINEWALKTFGEATPQHMMARAIQECSELLMEVTKVDIDQAKIAEECADIIGPLCRVADYVGIDITPVFAAVDFMPSNQLYSPAMRVTSRLVFIMERLGPINVHSKGDIASQIGRVVIDIAEICAGVGSSLREAINKKMEILQTRKWILDGNGAGHHIRNDIITPNQARRELGISIYKCQLGGTCEQGICLSRPECGPA